MTITIPFWIIPVAGFICGAIGAMTFDLLNRKKKCNHTALISKETPTWVNRAEQRQKDQAAGKKIAIMEIRSEIERLHKAHSGKYGCDEVGLNLEYLEDFLDTLPEQPELKPMNIPSAGGGMSTTPPKFKLDVKPEVDLEKEIIRYQREDMERDTTDRDIARHFYELGCRRTAEMYDDIEYNRKRAEESELSVDLEKEIDACWQNWLSPSNQKEVEGVLPKTEFATYARHFAEWGKNNLK